MAPNKHHILCVPAWYPCSFFDEPMQLLQDSYNFQVLVGKRTTIGKKKALLQMLKGGIANRIIQQNGYVIVEYPYINHLTKNQELKQLDKLTRAIGKQILDLFNGQKPNLVHIQSNSDTAVFVCRWAKQNNVPIILTEHILFIRHEINTFASMREAVYNQVNRLLCVSNYVYRNLLTSGFNPSSVGIIGNLIDDRFVPMQWNKRNGRIIFVASHTSDKDIHVLLDVVEALQGAYPIDIWGLTGQEYCLELGTTVIKAVHERNLQQWINFIGKKPHDELLKAYPQYTMLLSTSRSETFGLAIAEAIAYGTPVVCTDSGGVHDFVNDENGCIVPIADVELFVKSIQQVMRTVYNPRKISRPLISRWGRVAYKAHLDKQYNAIINEI